MIGGAVFLAPEADSLCRCSASSATETGLSGEAVLDPALFLEESSFFFLLSLLGGGMGRIGVLT